MDYLYLWAIGPSGLIVLGGYDGQRDRKYQLNKSILIRNGITPHDRWLGTKDNGAATQIIKHDEMGDTGQLSIGIGRAKHEIKHYGGANNSDMEIIV